MNPALPDFVREVNRKEHIPGIEELALLLDKLRSIKAVPNTENRTQNPENFMVENF